MATTTYSDSTFSVAAIGNRTDPAGAAVSDFTAEEARFVAQILTGGYLKPTAAFQVTAQDNPNMSVKIGSGTAKADYYVVEGQVGGQGNYVVRLDVTSLTVSVPAADASQARTDEVYLVVRDNGYDASARGLPQIGYRKGDLGGAVPGPDGLWEAAALLATIAVPALETAIETAGITDERIAAGLLAGLASDAILESIVNAKGDLIAATGADTVARVAVGANGRVLMADSGAATGVAWKVGAAGATNELTTSQSGGTGFSFIDLATVGAAVTVDVGPLGVALVTFRSDANDGGTAAEGHISFAISGANTRAAGATAASIARMDSPSVDSLHGVEVVTGLTPGSTTFTMKYRSNSGGSSTTFSQRSIGVVTF